MFPRASFLIIVSILAAVSALTVGPAAGQGSVTPEIAGLPEAKDVESSQPTGGRKTRRSVVPPHDARNDVILSEEEAAAEEESAEGGVEESSTATGPRGGRVGGGQGGRPSQPAEGVRKRPEPGSLGGSGFQAREGRKDKLTITGYNTFAFQSNTVSGNQQAFDSENYGAQAELQRTTSLYVDGPLTGNFLLHAAIQSSSFTSGSPSRWSLEYKGGRNDIEVGDLNVSLPGSEFTSFSRSLRGLRINSSFGKPQLSLVTSQTKAAVQTDVLAGNNSSGPYYLTHSPVVDGSEEVRVDEKIQTKGVDYTIDYAFGFITFIGVRVIPTTSTIAVSYEYSAPGQEGGVFTGLRFIYPASKNLVVGTTYLSQRSRGGGGTTSGQAKTIHEREEFFGQNTAGPYALIFRPVVEGSETITVAAAPQIRDADYTMDYQSGTFVFLKRTISSAQLIVVEYDFQPQSQGTTTGAGGNRSVFGLDGSWTIDAKKNFGLAFELAKSASEATEDTGNGTAFSLRTGGQFAKLNLNLGYRQVNPGFQRIETTGFQRNETGFDLNLGYAFNKNLNFQGRLNQVTSDSPLLMGMTPTSTTGAGGTFDQGQIYSSLTVDYPKWPKLQLTHQSTTSSADNPENPSASDYTSDNVTVTYKRSQFQVQGTVDLTRQGSTTSTAAAEDSVLTPTSTDTETRSGRLGLMWTPLRSLGITMDASSTFGLTNGEGTSASDTRSYGVQWTPGSKLRVTLNHYSSTSFGGGGSLGFGYGFGGSYGGYGTYGGTFFGGGFGSPYGGFGTSYGTGYGGSGSFGTMGGTPYYGGTNFGGSSTVFGSGTIGSTFGTSVSPGGFGTTGAGGFGTTGTGGFGTTGSWGYEPTPSSGYGSGYGSTTPPGFGSTFLSQPLPPMSYEDQSPWDGFLSQTFGFGRTPDGRHFYYTTEGPSRASSRQETGTVSTDTTTPAASESTSKSTAFSVSYALSRAIDLGFDWSHDINEGGSFAASSISDQVSYSLQFRPFKWLSLFGQLQRQSYDYTDQGGQSTTDMISLQTQIGDADGLNGSIYYQKVKSASPSTTEEGVATSISNDMASVTYNLTYPLTRRISLVAEYGKMLNLSNETSYSLSTSLQTRMSFGVDYEINRSFSFRLDAGRTSSRYLDPSSNYDATTLLSELRSQF